MARLDVLGFDNYPVATSRLLGLMTEGPRTAAVLLARVSSIHAAMWATAASRGFRPVGHHGFPCAYISDLLLPFISPAMVRDLVLPCYETPARSRLLQGPGSHA